MEASTTCTNGTAVVSLKGRLDFTQKDDLVKCLMRAAQEDCRHVNINLRDVQILDSTVIGLLAVTKKRLEGMHVRLTLSCAQEVVQNELDDMNLSAYLPIYATEEDAIASVSHG